MTKSKMNYLKIIFFIILIVFITSIPNYNYAKVTLGDINNDGKIDISDSLYIIRHISASISGKHPEWILTGDKFLAGDITQNGVINSNDMLSILRYMEAQMSETTENKNPECLELEQDKTIDVESITLGNTNLNMQVGEVKQITAKIQPSDATNQTVNWSTSNAKVATVNTAGLITAKGAGTATITVTTNNGKKATCSVVVKTPYVNVTGIKLNKTKTTIYTNKTVILTATVTPNNATDKTVTWTTSNAKVASVNKNGVVTGKSAGTAKITAKTSNGKTATCIVTVKLSVSSSTKAKNKEGNGYTKVITLGGRTFKLYKQSKGTYAKKHFNSLKNTNSSGTISNMGCGPSSIAIVLSGYGFNKNPYDIGKLLMKNSTPSGLKSMTKEIKALGMKAKRHEYSNNKYNEIKVALESGHQIVLWVGKDAPKNYWYKFTHSGYHFISLLGIDSSNNKVYVGNPGVSGGWFDLSTVMKATGSRVKSMAGWIEIYK